MKKIIVTMLILMLVLTLTACGDEGEQFTDIAETSSNVDADASDSAEYGDEDNKFSGTWVAGTNLQMELIFSENTVIYTNHANGDVMEGVFYIRADNRIRILFYCCCNDSQIVFESVASLSDTGDVLDFDNWATFTRT